MPSKTTLNARNLEALGAPRLAELLIEISTGDATAKRRLRLELAGTGRTEEVVAQVRRRLATLARSRSRVDWRRRPALVRDLDAQRRAVVESVAPADPAGALELMWQLLGLAGPVLARCDDSGGTVSGVFDRAMADLGEIAGVAQVDPGRLAERAAQALAGADPRPGDALVGVLAPALGPEGLEHLKALMTRAAGPAAAAHREEHARRGAARRTLRAIADAQGDVDAFIAQHDAQARTVPAVAAGIARRLLAAGRSDEAWRAVELAAPRRGSRGGDALDGAHLLDWEAARIEVLEALGRAEEAQAARWSSFERALAPEPLRAFLRRLPDFDDLEAEERALAYAEAVRDPLRGLAFLVAWPALGRAAALVARRAAELDGDAYEVLSPAADALAGRHPLAATLALRAMIEDTLSRRRTSRTRHAARHLLECESLAGGIRDWGAVLPHEAYVARLKAQHGRRSSFWDLVGRGGTEPVDRAAPPLPRAGPGRTSARRA